MDNQGFECDTGQNEALSDALKMHNNVEEINNDVNKTDQQMFEIAIDKVKKEFLARDEDEKIGLSKIIVENVDELSNNEDSSTSSMTMNEDNYEKVDDNREHLAPLSIVFEKLKHAAVNAKHDTKILSDINEIKLRDKIYSPSELVKTDLEHNIYIQNLFKVKTF